MLTLPIKKKWYDMILTGEKKEEYREICKYYDSRFRNCWGMPAWWGEPRKIRLRNGYRKDSPTLVAVCTISTGQGDPRWGAEPGKKYFVLHIHKVEEDDDEK